MEEATQRLFFALWPDPSLAHALAALAQEVGVESGGRAIPAGNVHLTLAFLGEQPQNIARELGVAAARIVSPSFALRLDRVDSWRKNAVAWAGVQSVPPELVALHQAIGRSLGDCGLVPEERPFAVHVTLVRRISIEVRRPIAPPLAWHATEFALVASELAATGARYRVLSRWPLS